MAVADIARYLTLGGGHRRQIQRKKMERTYNSSYRKMSQQKDYTQRGVRRRKLFRRPKRGKVRP